MTSAIQLSQECVPITTSWGFHPTNITETSLSGVCFAHVTFDMLPSHSSPTDHASSISSLIAERELDPRKAAALARARKKIAAHIEDSPELSLAALRLSKGLSQARLATIMGTQQPYIARIERGDDDLKVSTIENLAKALGETTASVFSAITARRATRESAS